MDQETGRGRTQSNREPNERRAVWARSAEEMSLIDQAREWAEPESQRGPRRGDRPPDRSKTGDGWLNREGRPGIERGRPEGAGPGRHESDRFGLAELNRTWSNQENRIGLDGEATGQQRTAELRWAGRVSGGGWVEDLMRCTLPW
ncbi:unnamed protein product [Linum trigynum]|uniref:Uncharacterized protein n=1 Tax=Linum trigynum TaxID=586398 RepID=A0AAV2GMA7_9ROSI